MRRGVAHHALRLLGAAEVGAHGPAIAAGARRQLGGLPRAGLRAVIVHRDLHAARGEGERDRAPHALAGAGDERRAAAEVHG